MQNFYAFIELMGMLVADPRTGVLIALLVVAAISDWRTYRIPNWLTGGGLVFGLVCNTWLARTPMAGLTDAAGGMLIGFGALVPMYVMRVMGGGDVKLMAMAGAFLGVSGTLNALLYTFVIGGLAALAFAVFHGALRRMFANIAGVLQSMLAAASLGFKPDAGAMEPSIGRMPYGVSISVGTIGFVVAHQLGFA